MRPSSFADRVIRWFDTSARDLPWRRAGTSPWAVLVSEVMLQQTQVSRVVPVYEEWLRRWPTPAALAEEPAGEAIRAWGRLGYPRRALRLHACAQAIVAGYHGAVPPNLDALLGLPGVGGYTARAVAVFAFGERHPVVDTNVRRLVTRAVLGAAGAGPNTTAAHLETMLRLLPAKPTRAARASAAFMELGALVCTARMPACAGCPIRTGCAWWSTGATDPPASTAGRSPRYTGSDRHVRGLLLGLARDNRAGLSRAALVAVWHDVEQSTRALTTLVHDGLLVHSADGLYHLPGS